MGVKLRERPGKGWYVLIDWKGQRKAKSFGTKKKLAQEFAAKVAARLKWAEHSGEPVALNRSDQAIPTLKDYLTEWLEVYADAHCKPSTSSGYRIVIDHHVIPVRVAVGVGRHNAWVGLCDIGDGDGGLYDPPLVPVEPDLAVIQLKDICLCGGEREGDQPRRIATVPDLSDIAKTGTALTAPERSHDPVAYLLGPILVFVNIDTARHKR